jgi:hypothetical protein
MNDAVTKRILKEIKDTLLVKERSDPFKDRVTLCRGRNLILGKGELNGFAYAHGMKADLISLILIMDEKDLAIGKSLIDEHDASSIKIEEVQFFIYYLEV